MPPPEIENTRKRCAGVAKTTGQGCNNPPMVGTTTCRFHSGREVKLTAEHKERIRQAQLAKPSFGGRRHTEETRRTMSARQSEQPRGEKSHAWKGGRVVHRGYVYVHAPDHPAANHRGYVLEHRMVMEEHLGRPLTAEEVVHHINEDKSDNRIENLEVMPRGAHSAHHRHAEFERYGVGNNVRGRLGS